MSSTIAAELGAAAEAIAGYRQRVSDVAASVGKGDDDLLAAVHEAERAIGVAERSIRRAIKVAAATR